MIYRGAFLSSEKANNHINISAVLPSVLANIRNEIRNNESNNITMLANKANAWQVTYQWQAEVVQQKMPAKKLDPFTQELAMPPKTFKLWHVQLALELNGLTKKYQFSELSWENN